MPTPSDTAARFWLGGIITIGFFATVFVVLFVPVPTSVRDIVLVLLGALIASFKEVTGFFFGSSSGSIAKDATIRDLSSTPPPPTDPAGRPIVAVRADPANPLPVTQTPATEPGDGAGSPRGALMNFRVKP